MYSTIVLYIVKYNSAVYCTVQQCCILYSTTVLYIVQCNSAVYCTVQNAVYCTLQQCCAVYITTVIYNVQYNSTVAHSARVQCLKWYLLCEYSMYSMCLPFLWALPAQSLCWRGSWWWRPAGTWTGLYSVQSSVQYSVLYRTVYCTVQCTDQYKGHYRVLYSTLYWTLYCPVFSLQCTAQFITVQCTLTVGSL